MVEGGTDGLDGSSVMVIPGETPAYSSYHGQNETDLTVCGVEQGFLSEQHHPSIKAIDRWKHYFEIMPRNISIANSAAGSPYEEVLNSPSPEKKREFCIRVFNEIFETHIQEVLTAHPPNKVDPTGGTLLSLFQA